MSTPPERPGAAWFDGVRAEGVVEESDDPNALDQGGWWAVLVTFEGRVRLWRFARTEPQERPESHEPWSGPASGSWTSSLDAAAYRAGVGEIRRRIRAGDVYQVNLCRVLTAPLPAGSTDPWPLAARLAAGNPAPHAGVLDLPGTAPVRLVSASPELLLARDGDRVGTRPIKGTGRTPSDLLPKDDAENVMITDMVRNDLTRVCVPGSVEVPRLLEREEHPGLVHLVSTVTGRLEPGTSWKTLLDAVLPAASVSGAPRSSALRAIAELEPVPRGPYCGAIGYVDADRGRARLAVGIRTFWFDDDGAGPPQLRFGTGAGITWGSEPDAEWRETELKAARLIALASNSPEPHSGDGPFNPAADTSAPQDADVPGTEVPQVQEASA